PFELAEEAAAVALVPRRVARVQHEPAVAGGHEPVVGLVERRLRTHAGKRTSRRSAKLSAVDRLRPLWDFDDLEASRRRFTEQLDREPDDAGRAEVLTQLARVEGLRGDYDACARLLDRAEQLAGEVPIVRVRTELERGRMLRTSGEPDAALP